MSVKTTTCAIAALSLFAGLAISTADAQIFQRRLGNENREWHYSIANTSDGGTITAGYRLSTATLENFHIVKYAADGSIIWERTFGGQNRDIAYSIQQTDDGGYIIAGESLSFQGGFEIVLLRLNAAGGFVWANTYPGTFMTDAVHTPHPGTNLDQAEDGRIFVVGNNAGFPTLITTRPDGTLIAANVYFDPVAGGPNTLCQIGFTDVEYDELNPSVVISGTTRYFQQAGTAGGAGGLRQDPFLFRTTPLGAPVTALNLYDWPDDFDNPNQPNVFETGDGLDVLPDCSVVLAGRTDFGVSAGRNGTHLVYARPDFTPVWGRDYRTSSPDGTLADVETAYAAVEFSERLQGFIQAGRIDVANARNAHMQFTDITGAPIWARSYGGDFFARGESVLPARECGFTMTGHINGFFDPAAFGFGMGEVYLVKTDDNGKTGCLEREVFPEPIAEPTRLLKEVARQPRELFFELPNLVRDANSDEEVFCFSDTCGDPLPCTSPCNVADLAVPFCVFNINDILIFAASFNAQTADSDLAPAFGVWDINDVLAFAAAFNAGCP